MHMEMKKSHIKKILTDLNTAYGDKLFPIDAKVAEFYYNGLKQYDPRDVWRAASMWWRKEKFPPTLADIINTMDENGLVGCSHNKDVRQGKD